MNIHHPIGSFVPVVVLPGVRNKRRLEQHGIPSYRHWRFRFGRILLARVDTDSQVTIQLSDLGMRYSVHPDCVNFLYDDPRYDAFP